MIPVSATIFVIGQESGTADGLHALLLRLGYRILGSAIRADDALKQISDELPDVVLIDLPPSETFDAIGAAAMLRKQGDVAFVFLTNPSDTALRGELAAQAKPFGFLVKPFDERELHAAIWMALHRGQAGRDHRVADFRLPEKNELAGRHVAPADSSESYEQLADAFNAIGEAVATFDASGCITWLNASAEALTGWMRAEALGRSPGDIFNLVDEATRSMAALPIPEVLQTGRTIERPSHAILISRTGKEHPVSETVAAIRDGDNKICGAVVVFHDQSRAVSAQKAFQERERLLNSINQSLIGSFVYCAQVSTSGQITCSYVSPGIEEITGMKSADFIPNAETFFSLVLLDELPQLREKVDTAVRSRQAIDIEIRIMHARDHRLRWLRMRGRVTDVLPDGAVTLEGTFHDITELKEAEAENRMLALVAARTVNGVVLTDPRARIEWVNEGFTRVTGYVLNEVRGRVPGSFLRGPETDPATVAMIREALSAQKGFRAELVNYTKQGKKYWVEIEVQPLRDANGTLTHFMAIEKDITERRAAECEVHRLNANLEEQVRQRTERLTLSEERFRRLAENMRDLLCMIDESGHFAYVSPSFHTVLGYSGEDLLGYYVLKAVYRADRSAVSSAMQQILSGGPPQNLELRFRAKNGHFIWIETNASAVRSSDGSIKGCVVTARDISERKISAERLRDSEQRYAHLVENIHDAIIRDDLAGRIIFANRRFVDWFGFSGRDLSTLRIEDYVAPEWRSMLRDRHDRRMRGEDVPARFEYEGMRADGRRMWVDVVVTPVHERGLLVGTQSVIRDINMRKLAEQAAQAVLSKTALVFGAEYYGVLAVELGRALQVNLVCIAQMSGLGRLQPLAHYSDGQMLELCEFPIPTGHPCEQVLSSGEAVLIESGIRESYPAGICGRLDCEGYYGIPLRAGGRSARGLLVIASTEPLRLEPIQMSLLKILTMRTEAEFLREQTEIEKAEMQSKLFQSQKFEALGTLAGGVAHDFNNILTGVINYTALAQADSPPSSRIQEFLSQVLQCADRAKELVRQILLFSRSEQVERVPTVLQYVIREALALLRATIPAAVKIESNLDADSQRILANANQVHQVVMNLGINAAQAMQEKGGLLTIKLSQRMVDDALVSELAGLTPGSHLCLEVSDTGVGMEPAVVARIFEPFFTTKDVGAGTGLGLAVVHSVVRSHEAAIRVRSRPGRGTTFELYFPVLHEGPVESSLEQRELFRGSGQHILYVDDEATVAKSAQLLLQRIGYRVTIFIHPEQGLEQFLLAPNTYDAVVTDFQMPGMSGLDLAREIMTSKPDIPIFVTSGFAGKVTGDSLLAYGISGFFQKPVDMIELAGALARALRR